MATIGNAPNNGYENHFLMAIIEKLYLQPETADVYFVFGDNDNCERVPAHKNLLAARSDVFNAMFYGDLKEKGDVEITDVSADAFKEFLQFFYRSKVNLTVENALDVVNLGKKYDVAASQSICDRFLKDKLTLSNDSLCSVYGLATYFDLDDVKKLCESKIVEDTETVFGSQSFLDSDYSVLSRILKFDGLSCSEVSVFHACMNWVKVKAKQEELTRKMVDAHLGDLFYEIRFGSITFMELADLTTSYGQLFTLDEYQEIVQIIGFKDFQPKMFKKDGREILPRRKADAAIPCSRVEDGSIGGKHLVLRDVEKTIFTVNESMLLGNLRCSMLLSGSVPVELNIYKMGHNGISYVLYSDKNIRFSDFCLTDITLAKPILIKPGSYYEIQFRHSSAEQVMYLAYILDEIVQIPGSDFTIEFLGDNKSGGIIHSLKFDLIQKA